MVPAERAEQEAVGAIMNALCRLIESNQTKLVYLMKLKSTLLQQMFV